MSSSCCAASMRTPLRGFVGDGDSHPKIRVKNLWRTTEQGTSLPLGVSVDIWKGTVVGVIGPNGSGKSTFLRALNRLWEPPVGVDDHDISNPDVLSLRRRVGMLFRCQPSSKEKVRAALRGEKLSEEKVVKYLSLADLESSVAARSASDLSVGQAQRVALARTHANEPEVVLLFLNLVNVVGIGFFLRRTKEDSVLLLDEPTSALDPISTERIEESIGKLRRDKRMTIFMVSHSVKQIQRIADLVFLLGYGQIVETLEPDQLCNAKYPTALKFLELSS